MLYINNLLLDWSYILDLGYEVLCGQDMISMGYLDMVSASLCFSLFLITCSSFLIFASLLPPVKLYVSVHMFFK